MIVSDNYADYIQNYYPSFVTTPTKKEEFRTISDYRWAINELIEYVHNYISESGLNPKVQLPVLKYIDAVVQFEYDMELFSLVNDRKKSIFIHAKNIAEDVEDILNAML